VFFFLNRKLGINKIDKRYLNGCSEAETFAPDYTKRFVFGDTTCKCCSAKSLREVDSGCMNATLRGLEVALPDLQLNSRDTKYSREVIFWCYIVFEFHNITNSSFIAGFSHENNIKVEALKKTCERTLDWLTKDYIESSKKHAMVHALQYWFKNRELVNFVKVYVGVTTTKPILKVSKVETTSAASIDMLIEELDGDFFDY
jgi:hypothetical protein